MNINRQNFQKILRVNLKLTRLRGDVNIEVFLPREKIFNLGDNNDLHKRKSMLWN